MRLSEIADAAEFASAAEHAIDTISYFLRAGGKVTLEGEGDHDENTLGVFAEITYRDGSKQVAGCAELLDTLGKIAEKLRAEGDEQGGGEVEAEGTVDRCLVCGGVFADNPL